MNKGLLYFDNATGQWMVRQALISPMIGVTGFRSLRLHPTDVEQMKQDALVFDNLEARVRAYPEVNFEVQTIATGTSEFDIVDEDVAKLIYNNK